MFSGRQVVVAHSDLPTSRQVHSYVASAPRARKGRQDVTTNEAAGKWPLSRPQLITRNGLILILAFAGLGHGSSVSESLGSAALMVVAPFIALLARPSGLPLVTFGTYCDNRSFTERSPLRRQWN